jgi:UDP-N-acetyl-D-mannosaminuronic acid transferase (WecB/TagA/CpsF family)
LFSAREWKPLKMTLMGVEAVFTLMRQPKNSFRNFLLGLLMAPLLYSVLADLF